MRIEFVKSAVVPKDYPPANKPEVGIVGRSNAGKSSFINAIGRSVKLAKVSSTPGKTRLLNFFDAGQHYRLVDMPGYGYAARARGEKEEWRPMVENYLTLRESLSGLILIMDIRRDWTQDEQLIADWVISRNIPLMVVLNKMDKVRKNHQVKRAREIAQLADIDSVFLISAYKRQGVQELEDYIFDSWIKPNS